MEYSSHTKLIAFNEDLVILTNGKTLSEAEAYANPDLATIKKWARGNNLKFNESKSKAMKITRERRRDKINIYFNNRSLE